MNEAERIEVAELMQTLETNKNRLDPRQYKELEVEINKRIEGLRDESLQTFKI